MTQPKPCNNTVCTHLSRPTGPASAPVANWTLTADHRITRPSGLPLALRQDSIEIPLNKQQNCMGPFCVHSDLPS